MNMLPAYFHPSTVLLLDDNARFLKNSILGLSLNNLYEQYHNPHKALQRLEENTKYALYGSKILAAIDELESHDEEANLKLALSINLAPIYQQYFNTERYKEVTLLVVDYAMPVMNGLDVCRQLKNQPIKKLLITGQADHRLAVEAFNEGLIDQFILKDDTQFYQKLNQAIDKLTWQYFIDSTQTLLDNLARFDFFTLTDPAVSTLLIDHIKQHKIKEGYLIDGAGSYSLFDEKNQQHIFAIKTSAEMLETAQIAKDMECAEKIIRPLINGEAMLFFWQEEDYLAPVSQWQHYLYHCSKIPGTHNKNYYYSLINNE